MLIIRDAQIHALARVSRAIFAERLAASIAEDFPEQAAELLGPEIRQAVDYGFDKAIGYGLDLQKDLASYVYLMFTFGKDFDTDPGCSWAAAHLRNIPEHSEAFSQLLSVAGQFEHTGGGLYSRTGTPRPN